MFDLDDLGAGNAVLWTLRGAERTSRFYEATGWYRDGADTIDEIPAGHSMPLIRNRIALR